MIIKTIGIRSNNAYRRAIDYILRPEEALAMDGVPYVITHNVPKGRDEAEAAYRANESLRLFPKSNNNRLIHSIVSLSGLDKDRIDASMLEAIARKYISLVSEDALYYGAIHMREGGHPHLHLLQSATDATGYSSRVSRDAYAGLKAELEALYPELEHSAIRHGSGAAIQSDSEYQMERSGRTSRKEELKHMVEVAHDLANSRDELYGLLKEDGIGVYERSGEVKGIEDGQKHYRFSTLGVDLEELDKRQEFFSEMEKIEGGKVPEREKDADRDQIELTEEYKRMKEWDELERE